MKNSDKKINLGKITKEDFNESKSIAILTLELEKGEKIKVRANQGDKIPNLDGNVVIIDENNFEKTHIRIQVKALPKNYTSKSPYRYSCDTKAINVVLKRITKDPVVIFMVDIENYKIYWKLITQNYAQKLNIGTQKNKTIYFDESDLYNEKIFIKKIKEYCESLKHETNENGVIETNLPIYSENYIEIQKQVDRINMLFDTDLNCIKKQFYSNVWKFGISYYEYEKQTAFGIYPIVYGENNKLIKDFDPRDNRYMYFSIASSKSSLSSLEKHIDSWIESQKNAYNFYKEIPVEFMPNNMLTEIVYNFLDKITINMDFLESKEYKYTYYKDEEEITNIIKLINGIEKLFEDIIQDRNISNASETVKILEPIYNQTGKFLLFNIFMRLNAEEEKILKKYIKNDYENLKLNFYSTKENKISLAINAINELQKRGINKISRIWKKKNFIKAQEKHLSLKNGYTIENLKTNLINFFNVIGNDFEYVCSKGKIDANILANSHNIFLFNNYMYKDYVIPNKNFDIKLIKNETEFKLNNIEKIETSAVNLFSLETPLYETIRLLIYICIMKNEKLKLDSNKLVNDSIRIDEIPIINYYLKKF